MTAARRGLGGRDAVTAGATAAVSAVALAAAPFLLSEGALGERTTAGGAAFWATAVTLALQCALILVQAFRPLGAAVAVAALPILTASLAPGPLYSITALPVLVAVFRSGLRAPARSAVLGGAASAALVAIGQFVDTAGEGGDPATAVLAAVGQAVIVVGAPLVVSLMIAARREARLSEQAALRSLTREREAQVGEAIAQERAGMARELHDIAAHHLSGIALMASAVERQLSTDPEAAREGIRQVRSQSTAVLDDLRRLVGLLRDPAATAETVQTLGTIPALVESTRATGTPVEYSFLRRTAGDPGTDPGAGIGPLGQLAAYRMVQESLTNAVRHAPGAAATVTIDDRADDRLVVAVVTGPRPPVAGGRNSPARGIPGDGPAGFGIVGMRERAALVGASFESGPTAEGGWRTWMSIPRSAPARNPEGDR